VHQDRSGSKDTDAASVVRPDVLAVKTAVQAAVRAGLLNAADQDWAELYAFNDPRDFSAYLRHVQATFGRGAPPAINKRVLPLNRPATAFNVVAYRLAARIGRAERLRSPDELEEILDDLNSLYRLARQVLLGRLDPHVDSAAEFAALAEWLKRMKRTIADAVAPPPDGAAGGPVDRDAIQSVVAEIHRVVAQDPKPTLELPADLPSWDRLTPREREVVTLLARDLTLKQIAGTLGISVTTVKTHIEKIGVRLDVAPRKVAILRALRIL
jgi:DNA-binding CsgD family transcriptional regulator